MNSRHTVIILPPKYNVSRETLYYFVFILWEYKIKDSKGDIYVI